MQALQAHFPCPILTGLMGEPTGTGSSASNRCRLALLYGGRSAEHDISLVSARFVAQSLSPARFDVVPIGIDRDGRWRLPGGVGAMGTDPISGDAVVPTATRRLIATTHAKLATEDFDVAFPVLHGPYGEDGILQGFLELAGIPYVGAGVLGSALSMDKIAQKELFMARGIPTAAFQALGADAWQRDKHGHLARITGALPAPVFVKPANMGSSIGVSKVVQPGALAAAIELALEFDDRVIVEEALEGTREIECAVLGNTTPEASTLGEIRTETGFYDYEAKYLAADQAELIVPAQLSAAASARIRQLALLAFQAVDCAGMARVDFFVAADEGRVWVNELNTIPGFTPISMYPRLWAASGVPAEQLVERLVTLAIDRHDRRQHLRTTR